jgi:hypothetical protein
MTTYNIPRARYSYSLGASDLTDDIEIRVQPSGGSSGSGSGSATLKLVSHSPGAPPNQLDNLSLTNVTVRITAPRCLLDTLIPKKEDVIDAGFSGAGQVAHWNVGNVIKGQQQQCQVNYVATGQGVRRFEFVVEATELPEPIRLELDLSPGPSSP